MKKKNPNPQGKGLVPIMLELDRFRPKITISAKKWEQITSELFTSMFVLESKFSFSPKVGNTYYLYKKEEYYRLSLISPKEWGENDKFGFFVGTCVLHEDLVWTLTLEENVEKNVNILSNIEEKREEFEKKIKGSKNVKDILPKYNEQLSFYQRILIWSLNHSLKISMQKGGYLDLSIKEAKLLGFAPK